MTTSDATLDRQRAILGFANSYVVKPVGFEDFLEMVKIMKAYWTRCHRSMTMQNGE